LRSLGLKVLQLAPAPFRGTPKPLRGEDFINFNQQLAQLTEAGLPVEHGLRLIAREMRSGRLRATVDQIAVELEGGTPLPEAFEKHRRQFPALYGRLIDAGIKANNLPAMLVNLGRYAQLVQRMRMMLWEALTYPAVVFGALITVVSFLGIFVLPKFLSIFKSFGTTLPAITQMLIDVSARLPQILTILGCVIGAFILVAVIIRALGRQAWATDVFVLPLPLIGTVMRRNLVARWCDAMCTGVASGLDLPAAIDLAGQAVGSPKLQRDGMKLTKALESGRTLGEVNDLKILPPTVLAVLDLGATGRDLPGALQSLSEMYQQQAELRLATIPVILTPILLIGIGLTIAVVIMGMFAPMISLIQCVSGPSK